MWPLHEEIDHRCRKLCPVCSANGFQVPTSLVEQEALIASLSALLSDTEMRLRVKQANEAVLSAGATISAEYILLAELLARQFLQGITPAEETVRALELTAVDLLGSRN